MNQPVTIADVSSAIRNVPDFPVPGIQFKDITTALKQPVLFKFLLDTIYEYYKDAGITKVVGIESRGFILGGALAGRLNAGFVPVRKPGKLPAPSYSQSYLLEYGENTLHIHKDGLDKDDVVLIHDDLLATGGSSLAAFRLVSEFDVKKIMVSFICELEFLNGRSKLPGGIDVFSLIKY